MALVLGSETELPGIAMHALSLADAFVTVFTHLAHAPWISLEHASLGKMV